MAGRVPSRAASSASRSRPAASAGGSRTACRGREVTVVRLIRADQALAGSQREDDRVVDGQLSALLPAARAFAIPMPARFGGITVREGAMIEGPAGWGEFSPFAEYGPRECARWLASALEAACSGWPEPVRDRVGVNVTVPAVGPDRAREIVAGSGCRTAKVKVGEAGQSDADDIARVEAVSEAIGPARPGRGDGHRGW